MFVLLTPPAPSASDGLASVHSAWQAYPVNWPRGLTFADFQAKSASAYESHAGQANRTVLRAEKKSLASIGVSRRRIPYLRHRWQSPVARGQTRLAVMLLSKVVHGGISVFSLVEPVRRPLRRRRSRRHSAP